MAYCHVRRAMAQRALWLEEQKLIPAQRREGNAKLLAIAVLHLVAVSLFTSGFLLSRKQVDLKSHERQILPEGAAAPPLPVAGAQEVASPQYDKVVVLVVDALRSDFVCLANATGSGAARRTRRHRRALPIFTDLCFSPEEDARAGACEVFEFVADAPTTTMQRVKGLVTGSLPTFVDIGSSLSAKEVEEDNLVHQMMAGGKRVTHMGDETWTDLFPKEFSNQNPFPSMEVNDLHTVDSAVTDLLLPAVTRGNDWDVLIAHFLGVDHAGHTFDIHSQEMVDKLGQMDGVIRGVAQALERRAEEDGAEFGRTLLLVMGDHGQTETGEHGGGSHEEVSTVLMAYRIGGGEEGPGFAKASKDRKKASKKHVDHSCGKVMHQLDFTATFASILGLPIPFSNVGQVSFDLWSLGLDRGAMGEGEIYEAFDRALALNTRQVDEYLTTYLMQSASPSFLSAAPSGGDFASIKSDHERVLAELEESGSVRKRVGERQRYLGAVARHARAIWTKFDYRLMILGIVANLCAAFLQLRAAHKSFLSFRTKSSRVMQASVLYGLILGMVFLSMLSNSYILSEGAIACFLITTILIYMGKESVDATNNFPCQACLACLLLLNTLMCNLIPEHSGDIWNGETKKAAYEVNALVTDGVFLATVYLGLIQLRRKKKKKETAGPADFLGRLNVKESLFLYTACLAVVHSFLKSTGQEDPDQVWHPNKLAKQVHLLTALSLVWVLTRAISLPFDREEKPDKAMSSLAIRAVFCLLPELYMLQVGNGRVALALAYVQIFVCIMLFVKIQFFYARIDLELVCLALFGLYCTQIFHATGHQCQFSSLQYNAAFVGFETFHWWRGAVLLSLNTWTSHILLGFFLSVVYAKRKTGERAAAFLTFGLTFSLQSVFVMVCAMIHSRHLMVWGVFAPKFIFNSVGLLAMDAVVLLNFVCFR